MKKYTPAVFCRLGTLAQASGPLLSTAGSPRKYRSFASYTSALHAIRNACSGAKFLLLTGALLFGGGITARAGLANANANANAKAVYTFMTGLTSGTSKRVLSGQNVLWYQPSSNGNTYVNDLIWNLENQTGKIPAIIGADLNDTNTNADILPELVTLAQTTGCLIEIDGGLTYPNQTSGQSLNHLLVGGTDNAAWIASMQTLAVKLQYLQSCNVTVLFRPLHEMNGSWCPYYTTDTTSFQNFWMSLYNHMTTTAGLNNLIWVFAPNNAGGSAAYNQLVSHPEYTDNSHTQTVTLNHLTVGHTYQMQVWSGYVNGGNRGIELSGSNGTDSATLNSGTGQYAIGKFTASSTSMSFTGTPAAANTLAGTGWAADGNLNAISVRDIGGSSGSQISWAKAQDIGTESDILTNGTYFDAALFNTTANGGLPLTVNGVTFNIVASGTSNATDPSGNVALTSQRILNTGGNSPSGPPSALPYYPGSAYVDVVGADCYGDTGRMTEYAWFNQLGKPIYYTEFGNGPATSAGTYNGTYNYETQLMPVIKNTYPNIIGVMAWSDWLVSGTWVYKSLARNVSSGMMSDPWTLSASDLASNGLGAPTSGLTGYYEITNQSNGQALTCNSFTNGAKVSVLTYGTNLWQQWGIAPDESGTGYTITDQWSGQVLICPSPGTSGSTQIQQYGEQTWEYKTWNITSNGDGTYTITNAHYSPECLALNGTNVVISTYTGATAQKWNLNSLYSTTFGPQIQWGAATNVATDTDVATNGTYVDAALTQDGANGGLALTVNGVVFSIIAHGNVNVGDPSGDITLSSSRNPLTGGNSPSGSANYNKLVSSTEYGQNNSQTVTLKNLTIGQNYQVQVWSAAIGKGNYLTNVTSGNVVTLSANTGQYSIGSFTAAATSLSFTAPNNAGSVNGVNMLNAVSLRSIP